MKQVLPENDEFCTLFPGVAAAAPGIYFWGGCSRPRYPFLGRLYPPRGGCSRPSRTSAPRICPLSSVLIVKVPFCKNMMIFIFCSYLANILLLPFQTLKFKGQSVGIHFDGNVNEWSRAQLTEEFSSLPSWRKMRHQVIYRVCEAQQKVKSC